MTMAMAMNLNCNTTVNTPRVGIVDYCILSSFVFSHMLFQLLCWMQLLFIQLISSLEAATLPTPPHDPTDTRFEIDLRELLEGFFASGL